LVNKLNVIDLEATCWDNNPPEGMTAEIIEIGIVVVDLQPEILEGNKHSIPVIESKRSILVKPQHSTVSEFCTGLTTITQDMLDDEGIPYADALQILRSEYDSRNRVWASWGDYDRMQFMRNCDLYKLNTPFGRRHFSVKTMFGMFEALSREVGVEAALKHIGKEFEGTAHRGHDDAENIAKLYIHLIHNYRYATH
jgi:inhibitor of KinA sporulation pathway (predicted exonuclease)